METTKVIFRMWNGQVIALFPEIPAECTSWYHCESYMHIGQHAAADAHGIIYQSRPATENEYYDLKCELESIGYTLVVKQRLTYAMDRVREETWREEINTARDNGCKVF